MKTTQFTILVTALMTVQITGTAPGANAQTAANQHALPSPTPWTVVSLDANSQIWERTAYESGPNGTVVAKKNRYTELCSGLNFWQNGQWRPSKEQIDILSDGSAVATNGQHQAGFPGDISQGVIQLLTPDGQLLESRPVGLFFEDDNGSVLIAVLTNSVGELVGSNTVIYPNAFEGATASLRYRYTRSGFEQDVVVQGQLPDPAALGLVPSRTRLGVLTAFFDTNSPVGTPAPTDPQTGLSDTTLAFGNMMIMAPGRAFVIGDTNQSSLPGSGTRTIKRWLNLNGHTFLQEEIPYPQVAPRLNQLPVSGRVDIIATNLFAANSILSRGSTALLSPRGLKSASDNQKPKMITRLAQKDWDQTRGLVLDYVTLNTSLINYLFQGDSTYYISGNVTLAGTNGFEGGAIIKYARGTGITVVPSAIADWLGSAYRPVVFTAIDDNTVGETISGSSGSPSGYYANAALSFSDANIATLSNLRIAYAQTGVLTSSGSASPALYNAQFINCQYAAQFSGTTAYLRNVLFANVLTNFVNLSASKVDLQNATVNNVITLSTVAGGTPGLCLTNCILANITNNGAASLAGGDNGFYRSTAFGAMQYTTGISPFQMVGAGSYYLTASNSFRNVGTTNVDPWLLAWLRTKTTYPPIVYSNTTLSAVSAFSPQAERDNNDNVVDLGWHYDPIDYFFGGVRAVTNIIFTAGTAAGWFELPSSYGNGYGISITNGNVATFSGTASYPCWFVRYSNVQEGGNALWKDKTYPGGIVNQTVYDPANPAILRARFTRFAHLCNEVSSYRDGSSGQPLRVEANDSEFNGGSGGYNLSLAFTNCLFYRGGSGQATADSQHVGETYREIFRNCTFYGGHLNLTHWESAPYWQVSVRDCAFDATAFNISPPLTNGVADWAWLDDGYNATNAAPLPGSVGGDVMVSNFNWQTSWFGDFYQPTNSSLIDKGDRTADQIGLYHFTTQTNQAVEGASTVDIGYHYVATDAYGYPLDSNGDGIPDYLQDANGNGIYDAGDLGDWVYGPYNGLTVSKGLLVFTPLK